MPPSAADFSVSMEGLRPKFLSNMCEQQKLMSRFCDALANDHDDEEALEAIRLLVHKMRGTGATYFYPELSHLAGNLEDLIQDGNYDIKTVIEKTNELLSFCRKLQRPDAEN